MSTKTQIRIGRQIDIDIYMGTAIGDALSNYICEQIKWQLSWQLYCQIQVLLFYGLRDLDEVEDES